MKVTIEHYIATNNPTEAQIVLSKYGVKVKNMPDMIRKMNAVMKKYGEQAVKDFAAINTPYKGMLLSTLPSAVTSPTPTPAPSTTETPVEKKSSACGCESSADGHEESSNACGCSGADGEEVSGCDGKKCSCSHKKSVSNVDGDTKPASEPKAEAAKTETKEPVQAPKEKSTKVGETNKADMMPLAIVSAIALITIVAIIKS